MLREQRVDAIRLLEATQQALDEDGRQLLSIDEKMEIEAAMAAVSAVVDGTDPAAIKRTADALNRSTGEFAARRMNASIQRALAGQRLDTIEV
jgi:molecular chaperone HscA